MAKWALPIVGTVLPHPRQADVWRTRSYHRVTAVQLLLFV